MHVEAFTNRTFPSTRLSLFAPGDAAYAVGDELELCYEADRPDLEGLSPEDAAQTVFEELNRDGRPNPEFPALSMGDVVSYRTRSGESGALAVELMGFRAVWPQPVVTGHDRAVYRQKLEAWDEQGR